MAKAANRRASHGAERARRGVRFAPRTAVSRAKKISVTVDERVLREVKELIRASGNTLSAHITEALARDLRRRHLAQLIEEFESAHGVITQEELAKVRAKWQG